MLLSTLDKALIDRVAQFDDFDTRLTSAAETAEAALNDLRRVRSDVERIVDDRTRAFPWLADAFAQYHELCDLRVAELLESKVRPAMKAAERVRVIAREKREWHKKYRIARNRARYYEALFPWLEEFIGDDLDELVAQVDADRQPEEPDADPVRKHLTAAEYRKLPSEKRNQLALDRYWARRKKNWEIGRDYERYIGYLYESEGFKVTYQGIVEGLSDLGRDLIASKGGSTEVVQCKRWQSHKTIREKHIFQLFGTTVEYWLKHRDLTDRSEPSMFSEMLTRSKIEPVFVTSTTFSPEAKEFAAVLGVRLQEQLKFDPNYPAIKCNVSRQTGEKIYHLPMDQQYDNVVIEPERGERYVQSVAEAESAGFRRAWRWRGTEASSGQ